MTKPHYVISMGSSQTAAATTIILFGGARPDRFSRYLRAWLSPAGLALFLHQQRLDTTTLAGKAILQSRVLQGSPKFARQKP
jgi:hypothetical protein